MAIDPNTIASIGRDGVDIPGAKAKAFSLADMMDRRQMSQLQLKQAQQEQSQQDQARQVLGQADLSSFEGQQRAAADVTKINPQMGMEMLRGFQQQQSGKNQLTQQQYEILGAQVDMQGKAAAGLLTDYDNLIAKGVPEQQAVAMMTPKWQQTVQQLQQTKLPDGSPALSQDQVAHLQQNPNFDPNTLRTVAQKSQEARQFLDKQFDQRRQVRAEERDERRVGVAERKESAAEAALAKKETEKKEGILSEEALDLISERALAGDRTALQNLGRGTQGSKNLAAVLNKTAEKARARGLDAQSIIRNIQETAAEGRTRLELGAREGRIAPRVQEAQNFARIALKASAAVPRGSFRAMNQLLQEGGKQASDPKLAAFRAANISLINAYAGAVGGGVMHIHDQVTAREMLSTADSEEAYKAVVNQLLTETEAALEAPRQVLERMGQESSPHAPMSNEAPGQGGPAVGDVVDGYRFKGGDPSKPESWEQGGG
jgi:hypothetical protein